MLALELRQAVEAAPRERLPELSAALWKGFAAGAVTEAEAEDLSNLIEARKAVPATPGAPRRPAGSHPRTSESLERRRRWAASGRMPPKIAAHFPTGEQAALAVIAAEVVKRNVCTLAIGAVAALAGV